MSCIDQKFIDGEGRKFVEGALKEVAKGIERGRVSETG